MARLEMMPDLEPGQRISLPVSLMAEARVKMTYLGETVFIVDQEDRDSPGDDGLRDLDWDDETRSQAVLLPETGIPAGDYIAVAEVSLAQMKDAGYWPGVSMPGRVRAAP